MTLIWKYVNGECKKELIKVKCKLEPNYLIYASRQNVNFVHS